MNYRHIYHAGNFADIFKHLALIFCLEKLCEKDSPFLVLDTHAGLGKYNIKSEESLKTFEAENGIKKLLKTADLSDKIFSSYLKILKKLNDETLANLNIYPGSPAIIKYFLRDQDKGIFAELNPADFLQLKRNFAGNPKISTVNEDGFDLLKSRLPHVIKRGVILIDPAFEKDQSSVSADYEKTINALQEGHKRFAHATYLVWHPIINKPIEEKTLEIFYQKMKNLPFEKMLHATFSIGEKASEEIKMNACGLFIINAPWQLEEKLNHAMSIVLKTLKQGNNCSFVISGL